MLFLLCWALSVAAAAASRLTPPVLPLIVRNPYLSTWLANARGEPWEQWPMFWTGQPVGLSVLASVAKTKTVYPLLGRPHDSLPKSESFKVSFPVYEGVSYDASATNLTYRLGAGQAAEAPVKLTLSFLSPITPSSTLRQSIPAAYMAVHVEGSADVNIYTDVNGEWLSGARESAIEWQLHTPASRGAKIHGAIKSWAVSRSAQQPFSEIADRAEWGSLRFTAPSLTHHQSGSADAVRLQFAKHGHLTDQVDDDFRPIDEAEPVFAFSATVNLSMKIGGDATKRARAETLLFSLALIQDPVVQFAASRGLTEMRPLWASFFSSAGDMLSYHHADFGKASSLALDYSRQLEADALASDSSNYRNIVFLSARQVLGATQFSGTPGNPILFLKEISSNGNFQTVDVIYPAFPFFYYTNPRWLAYLLEPLLEHQLSGQYPNDYSMHDIGAHYPNATGHFDGNDEYMPVEECGNMLIMSLALVNTMRHGNHSAWARDSRSRADAEDATVGRLPRLVADQYGMDRLRYDGESNGSDLAGAWVNRTFKLLEQWTGYLIRESLIPHNQLSTDDFAGWLANQTNLALKGIVGIRAMAELTLLANKEETAKQYAKISRSFIRKWQDYGMSRDGTHAKLAYTWHGSWTTLYNLFADSILCFHTAGSASSRSAESRKLLGTSFTGPLIPRKVYSTQSTWYRAVRQRYGLPLDSRHLYAKSDWQFFATAVTRKSTRELILERIAAWVNETVTDRPLTDLYDTEGEGDFSPTTFMARPVVGGHFARLALGQACEGEALKALEYLDEEELVEVDVASALAADLAMAATYEDGPSEL